MNLEDAYAKLNIAKSNFKNSEYTEALLASQKCLELCIKSFLDEFKINYKPEHYEINLDQKVLEAFSKFIETAKRTDWDIERYRKNIAKGLVLLNMLAPVRSKFDFGIKDIKQHKILAGFKEIFDSDFRDIADKVVSLTNQIYWVFDEINPKLKKVI